MMGTASERVVGYGNAASSAASPTAIRMVEMKSKVKEEAERDAARILRASWGTAIPVEPVAIAHELGIRVLEAQLDGNTLGALLKEPQEDPTILLNQQDSRNRRRFTCAHELGHYVRRSAEANEYARVDLRDRRSSTGEDPEEVYANEFAACLLMPEDEVKNLHELGLDDLEMALRFKVSREAMKFRLVNLGLAASDLQEA
jgi:Zn-dependent peptidase ImmA (M78 family)